MKKDIVLVTGASGGIGRAIGRAFAQKGWPVALHYNRNRGPAQGAAKEIAAQGGRAS